MRTIPDDARGPAQGCDREGFHETEAGVGWRLAPRAGGTLVEIMLACLILAIVSLTGAEYIFRGRNTLIVQKNRRLALEAANSRLEEVRGTPYANLTNLLPSASYSMVTIRRSGGLFVEGTERIVVSGTECPMTNTIQYFDADGGEASYDGVRATVSVGYGATIKDQVTLRTLVAP